MKISYLTTEDIHSGLFRNQVLEQLKAIVALDKDSSFQLIVLNPFWKAKKAMIRAKELQGQLGNAFDIKVVPMMPPLRYSLNSILLSKLTIWWMRLVVRFFVKFEGKLIHCRSYWATIVATKESTLPVLFDMRSLYPAESVAAGKMTEDAAVYKYWLKLEKECFQKSAVSTAVSHAMQVYVNEVSPIASALLIPISVNTKMVDFDAQRRMEIRNELGWERQLVVAYSGSLGYYGLNVPSMVSFFQKVYQSASDVKFLVLTANQKAEVDNLCLQAGIPESDYHVKEVAPKELGGWLSAADMGIHALPPQIDSSTRLGTKVVEYWAAGLPVIVNEYVGAAADIIRERGIGYVLEDNCFDKEMIKAEMNALLLRDRNEIRNECLTLFDVNQIADKYIKAYSECLIKK
jgi:glycosyltransferase involved in cell wall biosynthesis